jgi:hypothetical protein
MYDIDWRRLIAWLLPFPLRKTREMLWLNALIAPIKRLHGALTNFAALKRAEIRYNGQVCYLAGGLNDLFDPSLRGIVVEDATLLPQQYLFLESENKPLYLPVFLGGATSDFVVKVPIGLLGSEAQIVAFIRKYKLAGMKFEIIYY